MPKRNSRKSHHDYSRKRKLYNLRDLTVNNELSDDDSDDGLNQQLEDHIANADRLNEQLDDHEVENEENVQEGGYVRERQEECNEDQIDEENRNEDHQNELEDGIENVLDDVSENNSESGNEVEPNGGRENESHDDSENESENGREAESEDGSEAESEDESDEEDAQNIRNFDYEQLLYPGAPLTVSQSMTLILSLLVRHNVTQTCLSDIIDVINLHCIQNNNGFKNSLHKLNKFFSLSKKGQIKKTKHFYCANCQNNLENENDLCENCNSSEKSYFIQVPVKNQLQELYRRPGFYECLQHRFHARLDDNNLNITDLYSGSLYQKFIDNSLLADRNNISLTWYTDGVPVYKSSKVSMWPVYLSINELPFAERTKRENLWMIGLWFGPHKPNANNYFHKFYHQFRKLSTGINITLSNNQVIVIKVVLLIGTCDLPAKCQFFNFTYYNGAYGCPSCLWPGETYRLTDHGSSHTHVYRYTPNPEMRTLRDCLNFAEIAMNNDAPHMGVKGPCALSKLMLDFIAGTAIDQMHCIFGGVVKKLLSLWFDTSNRNEPYSLVDASAIINSRLTAIEPPSFIHRMPRSIDDLLHWKTSELKNWFFYYALPVLTGIMQLEYLEHFSLLVGGISLLNFDSITNADVNIASNLLNKFVREFKLKYGLKNCSINIHLILHLPQSVLTLGPLWANDCFRYEDSNGQYLNAINGTRHIDSQVIRSHNQQLKLQRFFDQLPEGRIKDFCFKRKQNSKICEQLQEGCYTIGSYKTYDDDNIIPNYVDQALGHLLPARKIEEYSRLLKNAKLYVSERYMRAIQTSSSYVLYRDHTGHHLGSISCFAKLSYCQCRNRNNCQNYRASVHQAVVQILSSERAFKAERDQNVQYDISYLYKCSTMINFVSISIDQLVSVCFEIKIENNLYIAMPVNSNSNE